MCDRRVVWEFSQELDSQFLTKMVNSLQVIGIHQFEWRSNVFFGRERGVEEKEGGGFLFQRGRGLCGAAFAFTATFE